MPWPGYRARGRELAKFSPGSKNTVSRRFVAEIISPRLAEILEFVNNELKLIQKSGNLAGGAVFVGGTAKLPGITELAKQELRLSSHIGIPDLAEAVRERNGNTSEFLEDPEFATALGLVLGGGDQEGWWHSGEPRRTVKFDFKKFIRNFLHVNFPKKIFIQSKKRRTSSHSGSSKSSHKEGVPPAH